MQDKAAKQPQRRSGFDSSNASNSEDFGSIAEASKQRKVRFMIEWISSPGRRQRQFSGPNISVGCRLQRTPDFRSPVVEVWCFHLSIAASPGLLGRADQRMMNNKNVCSWTLDHISSRLGSSGDSLAKAHVASNTPDCASDAATAGTDYANTMMKMKTVRLGLTKDAEKEMIVDACGCRNHRVSCSRILSRSVGSSSSSSSSSDEEEERSSSSATPLPSTLSFSLRI